MHRLGIPRARVRVTRCAATFQNPDVMAGLKCVGNFLKDGCEGISVLRLRLEQIKTMHGMVRYRRQSIPGCSVSKVVVEGNTASPGRYDDIVLWAGGCIQLLGEKIYVTEMAVYDSAGSGEGNQGCGNHKAKKSRAKQTSESRQCGIETYRDGSKERKQIPTLHWHLGTPEEDGESDGHEDEGD